MVRQMAAYAGPAEIKYLFIDGGCLREILKEYSDLYFSGNQIDFNYRALSSQFTKVFYYDALPPQNKDESDEDYENRIRPNKELFDYLGTIDGFHVYEGIAYRRRNGVQQKKVDIMIAVDMLTHSFYGNMHKATFLTSDLDFKPLIDALVQHGMYVTLWYGTGLKSRASKELISAADGRVPFDIRTVYNFTTNQFRKSFSIPQASGSPNKDIADAILSNKWQVPSCGEVELYKKHNSFLLVFPDRLNHGHYVHVKYDKLDLLRLFVKDVYLVDIPC